jgi:hypothetical protein
VDTSPGSEKVTARQPLFEVDANICAVSQRMSHHFTPLNVFVHIM